jgi:hypothetical protein
LPIDLNKKTLTSKYTPKATQPFNFQALDVSTGENLGDSRIEDFEFSGKTLGHGGFAIVRMATYRPKREKYAIKTFNRLKLTNTNKIRAIWQEIEILTQLNHGILNF